MWRRLLMLALCAMPALWADVCDDLPTAPPKDAALYGSNESLSFKLSVKSGGPAFRITVRPIWQRVDGRVIPFDRAHAGDIEVVRCQNGEPLQVLPITSEQPITFGSTFQADDLNFDGYIDFSLVTEFAASGGARSYWVFDPGSGIFVQNEFTQELRCGSDAVTSKYGGECRVASMIDFDPEKHEIGRGYFGGAMGGCPNTDQGEKERYRVVNNRLILIHTQEFERIDQEFCAVTLSDLVDGTMLVTEVRWFDFQGRRVR